MLTPSHPGVDACLELQWGRLQRPDSGVKHPQGDEEKVKLSWEATEFVVLHYKDKANDFIIGGPGRRRASRCVVPALLPRPSRAPSCRLAVQMHRTDARRPQSGMAAAADLRFVGVAASLRALF